MQVVRVSFVCLKWYNIDDWLTENDEVRSLVAQLNLSIAVVQTMIGSHPEKLKGGTSQDQKWYVQYLPEANLVVRVSDTKWTKCLLEADLWFSVLSAIKGQLILGI